MCFDRQAGGCATARVIALVLMIISVFLARHAPAIVYLQEGLNYPNGILGTNLPWVGSSTLITVTNSGLSYSNIAGFSPPANSAIVNAGTTAVTYRPLNVVPTNGIVYYSFLIDFTVQPKSYYITGLLQSTNTPPGGSADDPLDVVDNTSGSGYVFGIRGKGVSSSYATSKVISLNTVNLLVVEYDFATGTASLFVNPPPGEPQPASADATSANGGAIPDLTYLYLRSGGTSAGTFMISSLRVASTWAEVTPSDLVTLSFSNQPVSMAAGSMLTPFTVQIQNFAGESIASNNLPISIKLNSGTFASGITTVNTGPTGSATFSNLVITAAGTYTITASAPGLNSTTSTAFTINPGNLDHYSISAPSSVYAGWPFTISGRAQDVFNNIVLTNSSAQINLTSTTGNAFFDGNNDGIFGETNDNVIAVNAGVFSVNVQNTMKEVVSIIATDPFGRFGQSRPIIVGSNVISAEGAMLGAFLDSLQVNKYWLVGTSVNWLTGAPGGTGPNMTLGTDSHCSAFAAGALELLGIYILRPPDASDINLANNQANWLVTNSAGWFGISTMLTAQHLADSGTVVVASYKASSGSGHIAILRPTNRSDADINAYGPEECQSGDYNYNDTNIITGFSEHPGAFPDYILYYGHSVSYPVSPVNVTVGQCQISNQTFQAGITSIVGRKYQIQSSSNLTTWSAFLNFTNSNNSSNFYTIAPLTNAYEQGVSQKYYRVLDQ